MSTTSGTVIAAGVVPSDTNDAYPTHYAEYGKGGHRTVATLAIRDAISTAKREKGMTVYVEEDKTTYALKDGISNTNWEEDKRGSSIVALQETGNSTTDVMSQKAVSDELSRIDTTVDTFGNSLLDKGFRLSALEQKNVTIEEELSTTGSKVEAIENDVSDLDAAFAELLQNMPAPSDENFTTILKTKLENIAAAATKNNTDQYLTNRDNHTGTQAMSTILMLAEEFAKKVDKIAGKGLSANDYTNEEKQKLANVQDYFKGGFSNAAAILADYPSPQLNNIYALNYETTSFWYYKDGTWIDSENVSTGDMLAAVYDPTGKHSDVYSMGNMVETVEKKIFTKSEREKLAALPTEATGGNVDFATNLEVEAGTVANKAVAPDTIANNYHNKNAINTMITNLELANTGYNVFEEPKFELNVEVLTTERWIDGRPIYRKTINCGALPNNNTKLVDHGIAGYDMIKPDLSNCYTTSAGFSFALPRASTTASGVIDLAITSTQVRIITGTAWTGYNNTFVTINYTKLSDNSTSLVAKVPIILEGLTELPSPKLGIEVLTASRHPVTGKPIYSKTVDCGFLANTSNGLTITPVNVAVSTDYMQVIAESSCVVIPGIGNFSFGVHMPWYTLASQIGAYIEDGSIVIGVGSPQGNKKAYVTVEYTKTADTALSPAALIGGRGMSLYEHWLSVGNSGTEAEFVEDMKGRITTDILTSEQLAQLNGRLLAFGQFGYKNITAVAYTIGTTKIPVFTTRKIGELIATNNNQFTLKANVTYFLDFNISASPVTNELDVSIINDLDNSAILNKDVSTLTITSSGTYFTPTIDTPISLRITSHNNTTSGTVTTAILDSGIKITEYSTVDLKLSRLTINGNIVDENNNVDLQGVGNMASPKLNVEVLTEYRHPVSSKPIYTKTIAFGALPNSTTKTVSLGIADTIDALWIDPAFSHGGTFPVPSNYYANSDGYTITTSAAGKSVTAKANGNYSAHSIYVTVRYTKTADTASSPIRLVGGNTIL